MKTPAGVGPVEKSGKGGYLAGWKRITAGASARAPDDEVVPLEGWNKKSCETRRRTLRSFSPDRQTSRLVRGFRALAQSCAERGSRCGQETRGARSRQSRRSADSVPFCARQGRARRRRPSPPPCLPLERQRHVLQHRCLRHIRGLMHDELHVARRPGEAGATSDYGFAWMLPALIAT